MSKCPKCNTEIKKGQTSCSKCGKVLKIKCPRCGTFNSKALCTKCKLILLIRCKTCNSICSANERHCKKCNTSVPYSIISKTAKLKEFSLICIDFLNIDKLINSFDDEETGLEFRKTLYKKIESEALISNSGFYEIEDNLLTIDFSHKHTIGESCESAIDTALNLVAFFEKLNKKLKEQRDFSLKIRIAVSTRNITDRRLSSREERAICPDKDIEIITNQQVFKYVRDKYEFEPLISTFINNQVITFYKLLSRKYFAEKKSNLKNEETALLNYPEKIKFNDIELLEYPELRGDLSVLTPLESMEQVDSIISQSKNGFFINILGRIESGKINKLLIKNIKEKQNQYEIQEIYCAENYKYQPFGLIKNIIKRLLQLDGVIDHKIIKTKLSSILKTNTEEIENLLISQKNISQDFKTSKQRLFAQIKEIFKVLSFKKRLLLTLHDFDYVDRASLECFKFLLDQNFINNNLCLLISTNPDFPLTEKISKLNLIDEYHEIILKSHNKVEIIEFLNKLSGNFKGSFFFEKTVQNSQGSIFFVEQILDYLQENEIIGFKKSKLNILSQKSVSMPIKIEDLIKTRINNIVETPELSNLYIKLILLGCVVPNETIKLICKGALSNKIDCLIKRNLIEHLNNDQIALKHYNLFKTLLLQQLSKNKLKEISKELLEELPAIDDCLKAELLDYACEYEKAAKAWNKNSMTTLSHGDITAFAECSKRYLRSLEFLSIEKELPNFNEIKYEIYEKIAQTTYESYPEKAIDYLKDIIKTAENLNDTEKIIKYSSLMIQASNSTGNYLKALDYLKKIILIAPKDSFNIKSNDFNLKFYLLNFIKIQALFNIGKTQDCIDLAQDLITDIEIIKTNKKYADFIQSLDYFIKDIRILLAKAKIIQMDNSVEEDFNILKSLYPDISTKISILSLIYQALCDITPQVKTQIFNAYKQGLNQEDTLYCSLAQIICHIQTGEWKELIKTAYITRFMAREQKEFQILYLLDLFMGLSYKQLIDIEKSRKIYEKTLKLSAEKNILNVMLLSWILIAKQEFEKGNLDIALNITNKACIVLENNNKAGKIFLIHLKYLQGLIFIKLKDWEGSVNSFEMAFRLAETAKIKHIQIECLSLILKLLNLPAEKNSVLLEKIKIFEEKLKNLSQNTNIIKS